jgi:hypothetical protein
MNGPEHYREAEKQLEIVTKKVPISAQERAERVAEAQVHATLALAAASVQWTADGCAETVDAPQWRRLLMLGELPKTTWQNA